MNNTTLPAESVKSPVHFISRAYLHAWADHTPTSPAERNILHALIDRTRPHLPRPYPDNLTCEASLTELATAVKRGRDEVRGCIKLLVDKQIVRRWARNGVGPLGLWRLRSATQLRLEAANV